MLTESHELAVVLDEGQTIAESFGSSMTSAHVLLCLFLVENQAKAFLDERGLSVEDLLESMKTVPQEAPEVWTQIRNRAHDIARVHQADTVDSLHMLVALCSFVTSSAYELIQSRGVAPSSIRSALMAWMHSKPQEVVEAQGPAPTPRAPSFGSTPLQGGNTAPKATAPRPVALTSNTTAELAKRLQTMTRPSVEPKVSSPKLAPLNPSLSNLPVPSVQQLNRRRAKQGEQPATSTAPDRAARAEAAPAARPAVAFKPEAYKLSPKEFPLLTRVGRNLSEAAVEGRLDQAIGRDEIIIRLIDTLNKRRSNNPLLVGEPGVGKTAIVEGFARYLIDQAREGVSTGLEGRVIVSIEASSMVAGTSVRGAFAERMTQLKQEVKRANGRVIVFFDELHHWIGAGGSNDGGGDASGELKTALARGEFPCIGATTWAEYAKYIEPDSAFTRRFETVRVVEPDLESTLRIVQGVRGAYEEHHGIEIDDDGIDFAVKLAHRYLPNRRNPDKSFAVIDFAGALARRAGEDVLSRESIARAVADQAGIDPSRLMMAERERYAMLDTLLAGEIVGQKDAVKRTAALLQRNYAGFAAGRPIGSFLFLGPTGVGKTEFARAIARILFGDDEAMLRIDMSEYMEAHSVARLIGAPPGYVGHDAAGMLTEPVRRSPYQLVLLDELEKAHPEVLNLLIQVLDEGRLTDSRGNTVDFTNTIVVMTTNLGADALAEGRSARPVGFTQTTSEDRSAELATREAKKHFRPEIWNRIDEVIVFPALSEAQVATIAERLLAQSSERLFKQRGIRFECSPAVIPLLIDAGGYDRNLGARPMRRTIERVVEHFVATSILEGSVKSGDTLYLDVEDGSLTLAEPPAAEDPVDTLAGPAGLAGDASAPADDDAHADAHTDAAPAPEEAASAESDDEQRPVAAQADSAS